jgi:hypothetical protein
LSQLFEDEEEEDDDDLFYSTHPLFSGSTTFTSNSGISSNAFLIRSEAFSPLGYSFVGVQGLVLSIEASRMSLIFLRRLHLVLLNMS